MSATNSDRWRWVASVTLLTALYLLVRTIGLDRIVTTDEPFWLGRSANFYRALWQGDLIHTFQHAHPGVTTMWAGMVGYWFAAPDYVDMFESNVGNVYGIHQRLREMGLLELDVLIAARIAKIALQAVLFTFSLVWLRRLFGRPAALLAGAIIALDPFLIAHDRLLHVDGLLVISSFAAVLAFADAVTRDRNRLLPWIVAGVLAAVAWLTRSTGLALIGVVGLVLLTDAIAGPERGWGKRVLAALGHGVLWAGAAVVTTIALWPVLWVAPERALSFMVEWISGAAAEGHELPVYFLGEMRTGDPGPLFYPVTIAWRMSIAGSIGLVLMLLVLAIPGIRRRLPERALRAMGILMLFAAVYVAGMTLGAKKFDRYALPAYPVLDTIAAIGFVAAFRSALPRRESIARVALPVVLVLVVLGQAVATLGYRPIYLTAYNPLLGGAEAAEDVLQIGWGEGLDAAARWVIDDTGIRPGEEVNDPPLLRTSGGHAPLLYSMPPPYVVESSGFRTVEDWQATDYYVATIQQWQRDISGDVIGYLRGFEPDHSVWIEGVRHVDVWSLAEIPPPPWLTGEASCEWRFDPWLQLENIVTDGTQTTLWFQTLATADLPQSVTVTVELVPRTMDVPAVDEAWSATLEPRRGRRLFTEVSMEIPPLAEHGISGYVSRITVVDDTTGEFLPGYGPDSGIPQSVAVIGSDCASEM